jgi:FkbM family methyltransferase
MENKSNSSNIFLDCGAHKGESIAFFLKKIPDANNFKIHSFECNPTSAKILKEKYKDNQNVLLHESAVWIDDNGLDFFLGNTDGCTVIKSKTTGNLDKKKPIRVSSVSLSKFIFENFKDSDNIILKIDIEGAEYEVLNDLIKTGAIKYVKQLFGEWHHKKIGLPVEQHTKLVSDLSSCGLRMREWCALTGVMGN